MHQTLAEPKGMPDHKKADICETRICSPTEFGIAAFHVAGNPSITAFAMGNCAKGLVTGQGPESRPVWLGRLCNTDTELHSAKAQVTGQGPES
jgi:hypothetical protein